MWPGAGFLGVLGFNYLLHRLGLQTFCQWLREHLPPWLFLLVWAAFNRWFIPHVLRGYKQREQ